MSRTKSVVAFVLALGLLTASLAFAQGATSTSTPTMAQPSTSTPAMSAKASKHGMSAPKVDLNSASKEELVKLPGIGDAIADKIIAARPFKSKSELESKGIVTKAVYGKIASHVIAKQAKTASK